MRLSYCFLGLDSESSRLQAKHCTTVHAGQPSIKGPLPEHLKRSLLRDTVHTLSWSTELTPPCFGIVQEHDQAVDPNLVRLASAYDQAVAQLGGDAPTSVEDDSSDGEEAAMNPAFVPSAFQQNLSLWL